MTRATDISTILSRTLAREKVPEDTIGEIVGVGEVALPVAPTAPSLGFLSAFPGTSPHN